MECGYFPKISNLKPDSITFETVYNSQNSIVNLVRNSDILQEQAKKDILSAIETAVIGLNNFNITSCIILQGEQPPHSCDVFESCIRLIEAIRGEDEPSELRATDTTT